MNRRAAAADATAIRELQVRSWPESYVGIVPDAALDGLDPTPTEWHAILAGGSKVLVTEDAEGMAGFIAAGRQPDAALPYAGEIYAIYLLRRAQGRGWGGALMRAAAAGLLAGSHRSACLWVVTRNTPAVRFYLRLGGRPVREDSFELGGAAVAKTAIGWGDLSLLARS